MRNNQGFTLIELMITISLAAIIMVIALPSMQTMRANSRVSAAASDLASDLKKSRNAAILARRNQTFSALDSSVSSNVWGNGGWKLEQVVSGSTQTVFQNKIVPQGVFVNATPNAIVFVAATGMVQTPAGNAVVMTFSVCDSQVESETGYDVLMNQFGRVLTQKHNDTTVCNP